MNDIQVLDKNTIDKIAAGEVVERPSSVVKELVENAIDAGATAVTVEIADGGRKLIRITDNGSGIDAGQVPAAFLRHATSKIRKVEDLEHIASLGFRGEALSSIAAVAQVELITKTPSAMAGTRYLISGGTEEKIEETGAPDGTTFLVRNLFYNTPARAKFLKSDTTEAGYISTLMEQLAMSHPEISFKYIQNRQVRLHTSGNYSPKEVIYSIYGRDIARSLIEVSCSTDFMEISGFVGKPEIARGNRSFENYYINGRFVRDKIIAKAIEDGYKGFLMQHKFPFVSLNIEMKGNELDVNVHPSKMEVRFARGPEVYETICRMVQDALSGRSLIPTVQAGKDERTSAQTLREKPGAVPEPFEVRRLRESRPQSFAQERVQRPLSGDIPGKESMLKGSGALTGAEERLFAGTLSSPSPERADVASLTRASILKDSAPGFTASHAQYGQNTGAEKNAAAPASEAAIAKKEETFHVGEAMPRQEAASSPSQEAAPAQEEPAPGQEPAASVKKEAKPEQLTLFSESFLKPESRSRIRVIGQLFDTYWLTEYDNSFFIIDQHAAHEKVYYERFLKKFRERTIESQNLCPPMIVTLSMEEEQVLLANQERFLEAGFEVEPFGGREFAVRTVPTELYHMTEQELFKEMLDSLSDVSGNIEEIFCSRLATMACKAAVKGNNRLSVSEAEALIDEMMKLKNPYHCPHGRPTVIEMTKQELEHKFKRIV